MALQRFQGPPINTSSRIRRESKRIDFLSPPLRTASDPGFQRRFFFIRQRFLRRHRVRCDMLPKKTILQITGFDNRSRLSSGHGGIATGEIQLSLGVRPLVTAKASLYEQRCNRSIKICRFVSGDDPHRRHKSQKHQNISRCNHSKTKHPNGLARGLPCQSGTTLQPA